EVCELVDLGVVQPTGGLVHQQQPRLRDERAGELDALEPAARKARGPGASVRAIWTRLSVPNGGLVAGRCATSPMPTRSSVACAFARIVRSRSNRDTVCAPTSTFSSTVIVGKSSTFWNVRAMPSFTTRLGGVCRSDLPSKTMSPES